MSALLNISERTGSDSAPYSRRASALFQSLGEEDWLKRMSDEELIAYAIFLVAFSRALDVQLSTLRAEIARRVKEEPRRFMTRKHDS